MEKIVYEVCTRDIELRKEDISRKGWTAEDAFQADSNQTPDTCKKFESEDEAKAYYVSKNYNNPDAMRDMGRYYLGTLAYIAKEIYEVDEDGDEEWIDGGDWIEYAYPKLSEKNEADEDDDEE